MRQDYRRKYECLEHCERLGNDKYLVPVEPVGDDAGYGGEEEHHYLAEEADKAEEEDGVGHLIDKPGLRHVLYPCADEGKPLAHKEEPVVPVCQRTEGVS